MPRGNWMDDSGAVVEPAIPGFFGKLDTGGRRATRLDLANWIVSDQNPLTARVLANRFWREFFGTGISKIGGRSRLAGRVAHASRTARLAGVGVHRRQRTIGT